MNLARNAWIAYSTLPLPLSYAEPIYARIEQGCASYKIKILVEGWDRYPNTITLVHTYHLLNRDEHPSHFRELRWDHRSCSWDIDRSTKVDNLV